MKGLILLYVMAVAVLVVTSFFGWKMSSREAKKGMSAAFACGLVLWFNALIFPFVSGTDPTTNFIVGMLSLWIGFFIMLLSPLVGLLVGLANGRSIKKSRYSKLKPSQKQKFWDAVRGAVKVGLAWYARREQRRGNSDTSRAAKYAKKAL